MTPMTPKVMASPIAASLGLGQGGEAVAHRGGEVAAQGGDGGQLQVAVLAAEVRQGQARLQGLAHPGVLFRRELGPEQGHGLGLQTLQHVADRRQPDPGLRVIEAQTGDAGPELGTQGIVDGDLGQVRLRRLAQGCPSPGVAEPIAGLGSLGHHQAALRLGLIEAAVEQGLEIGQGIGVTAGHQKVHRLGLLGKAALPQEGQGRTHLLALALALALGRRLGPGLR